MPTIAEILAQRAREHPTAAASQSSQVTAATVVRADGPRFVVNDGFNTVTCYSVLTQPLREGDRVWIVKGRGANIILGLAGTDVNFS